MNSQNINVFFKELTKGRIERASHRYRYQNKSVANKKWRK